MDPFTAATQAVSIGSSLLGSNKANKAAKKAAKSAAHVAELRVDEVVRQQTRQAGKEKGAAVAGVAASNLQMSGSSKRYVDQLDFENMREIAYTKAAGRLEQQAIKNQAQGAGDAMLYGAVGNAIGMAAGALAQKASDSFFGGPLAPTLGDTSGWAAAESGSAPTYGPTPVSQSGSNPNAGSRWGTWE